MARCADLRPPSIRGLIYTDCHRRDPASSKTDASSRDSGRCALRHLLSPAATATSDESKYCAALCRCDDPSMIEASIRSVRVSCDARAYASFVPSTQRLSARLDACQHEDVRGQARAHAMGSSGRAHSVQSERCDQAATVLAEGRRL